MMKEIIKALILWILATLLAITLNTAVGLWLWGLIMIPIFSAPVLTFWQMFGLCFLARVIVGGMFKVSFGKNNE